MPFIFFFLLLLTLLFVSDRFDQILSQFSQAMTQAITTSHPLCNLLRELLECLCNSKSQNKQLTEIAYGWCSVICENYSTLRHAEDLLLLSLETGFRCSDVRGRWIQAKLIHTEHHQKMANIVFRSGDSEAIADLLHAWTSHSNFHGPHPQLKICAEYLTGLHHIHPSSPRLQSHTIDAIRLIGHQRFGQVGVEEVISLLNDLQVCAKYLDVGWLSLLLDAIHSSENIQYLSLSNWEFLVELAAYWSDELEAQAYNPQIMISLQDAQEWDKLKCWVSVMWLVWPPGCGQTTEEDLENVMLSLFHQQPGALQKLEEQMEQWNKIWYWFKIPELFKQTCKQVREKAAQQATL